MTEDWPVYSPPHTDEAKRGGGATGTGRRGMLAIWQRGKAKSIFIYMYVVAHVVAESSR